MEDSQLLSLIHKTVAGAETVQDAEQDVSNTDERVSQSTALPAVHDSCQEIDSVVIDQENDVTNEKPKEIEERSKDDLEKMLLACNEELEQTKKKLSRTERQLEKTNNYNESLRTMIEKLSGELHQYKSKKTSQDHVAIQVDQEDLRNYSGEIVKPSWGADSGRDTGQTLSHSTLDACITEPMATAVSVDQPADKSLTQLADKTNTADSGLEIKVTDDSSNMSIADAVRATAEAVVTQQTHETLTATGYMYDGDSGLYYHPESGYYYDQEKCLFYEPHSGSYYYYDYDSGEYMFHSQVDYTSEYSKQQPSAGDIQEQSNPKSVRNRPSSEKKKKKSSKAKLGKQKEELVEVVSAFEEMKISSDAQLARRNVLEYTGSWPPCVRMIVQQSEAVDVGMLYIVTCVGATIGRDQTVKPTICIPDSSISKLHAEICFNETLGSYIIKDRDSQNGTFINSTRISKETGSSCELHHGDIVQLAGTQLLCHIHQGTETCDQCEPGIVMANHRASQPAKEIKFLSKEDKQRQAKLQMKQLKKKYGLQAASYKDHPSLKNANYTDRADERRRTVGSDTPHVRHEAPTSVHRPLSTDNVGHKLLQKMGWKEGESLGKNNSGIHEPISVGVRANRKSGLGSGAVYSMDETDTLDVRKASRRIKAQQRFDRLAESENRSRSGLVPEPVTSAAVATLPSSSSTLTSTSSSTSVAASSTLTSSSAAAASSSSSAAQNKYSFKQWTKGGVEFSN